MTAVLFYWGDFWGHGTPASRGMRDPASFLLHQQLTVTSFTINLPLVPPRRIRFLHFMPSGPLSFGPHPTQCFDLHSNGRGIDG